MGDHPDQPIVSEVQPENVLTDEQSHVTANGRLYEQDLPSPNRFFWRHVQKQLPAQADISGLIAQWRHTLDRQDAPVGRTVDWALVSPFDLAGAAGRRIAYRPAPGLVLPADIAIPPEATHALVMVDQHDRRENLHEVMEHIAQGAAVYLPDLRGWGETQPEDDWSDKESLASALYSGKQRELHGLALMTGRNLVLDRAHDILALIDVAGQITPGLPIHLQARRNAVMPALVAALVEPRIVALKIEQYLVSFRQVMDCDAPLYDGSSFIHGLLQWGVDMNDLLAAYHGRLTASGARDPMLRPTNARGNPTQQAHPVV
jgi:hypothetical protein